MDKINVAIPSDYNGTPIQIELLEGEAKKPINLKSVSLKGTLESVKNWYTKRQHVIKHDCSHVLIDVENGGITLVTDENHPNNITISGALIVNPELAKFGINQAKMFSPNELASLIKLNRAYFANHEAHSKLLINLKNHNANITRKIEESNDDRGNAGKSDFTNLISNIDEKFTLNMPIYKGQDKSSFEVNICLEVRDRGISMWLESVELKELQTSITQGIIAEHVEFFNQTPLAVIIQ